MIEGKLCVSDRYQGQIHWQNLGGNTLTLDRARPVTHIPNMLEGIYNTLHIDPRDSNLCHTKLDSRQHHVTCK
jgi:hypothetical protein